jgi:hypothetical protein
MGKRELVLILSFVVVGAVVYQLTAPAATEGQSGFSISRIIDRFRSEIRGNRVMGQSRSEATAPVAPGMRVLRVLDVRGTLTAIGEDRDDVAVELVARAYGPDQPEADALAGKMTLRLVVEKEGLGLSVAIPENLRRYRVELTVRLPSRLTLDYECIGGKVEVRDVAAVRMRNVRTDATFAGIPGEIRGEQRDGELRIQDAGSLSLTARRVEVRIGRLKGESSIEAVDGDIEIETAGGPLRLETRRAEIEVNELLGPLRAVATDGRVRLGAVSAEARVEAQRATVVVRLRKAVALDLVTTDDPIEVEVPAAIGVTVDATTTDGRIEIDGGAIEVTGGESQRRANGALNGGGPTIELRATRGDIRISTGRSQT